MTASTLPRLLMLTHRFPYPPNRGDRIRSYNMLRVLTQHFNVSLGCTADESVTPEQLDHLRSLLGDVCVGPLNTAQRYASGLKSLATGRSLTEGMFASPSLASTVRRWQVDDPFDVVLVFCSSMFPYIENDAFAHANVVVDLVDVDSEKWRQMSTDTRNAKRWIFQIESKRVRRLEQRIAHRANAVTLVSDAEAALYRRTVEVPASTPVDGVSNGVDTAFFRNAGEPLAAGVASDSLIPKPRPNGSGCTSLVFTGVLDYPPNVEGIIWFCDEVLPLIQQDGGFELSIVGRRPVPQVIELSSRPGVTVEGEVPDVRPFLRRADIAISPLHLARGIQNKVLEAMSMGLPVVATPQSAEGIEAVHGKQLVVADSKEAWHVELGELAQASSGRNVIGDAARELVEQRYSWAGRLKPMIKILKSGLSVEA